MIDLSMAAGRSIEISNENATLKVYFNHKGRPYAFHYTRSHVGFGISAVLKGSLKSPAGLSKAEKLGLVDFSSILRGYLRSVAGNG